MTMTARHLLTAAVLVPLAVAGCGRGDGVDPVAATTSQGTTSSAIDGRVEAALSELYRINPQARQLANQAEAVLVFPEITKGGLGIGALYGTGAMRDGGTTTGYYNIAGGTLGFQIGAQTFSQAYFFNNEDALATFRTLRGLELGAEASAVAADFSAAGEISSSTLQQPVVVATWGQSGLMAGATVEGAKITEINP